MALFGPQQGMKIHGRMLAGISQQTRDRVADVGSAVLPASPLTSGLEIRVVLYAKRRKLRCFMRCERSYLLFRTIPKPARLVSGLAGRAESCTLFTRTLPN